MHALVFDSFGGPEVLSYREIPAPTLSPGMALVRMHAVGLNFADLYRRRGTYHLDGAPPWVLGYEGAGVIEAIDRNGDASSEDLVVGARVAFADVAHANAEVVRAPCVRLVLLPASVSFESAAAVMLQGLTAHYLIHDSHRITPGEIVVVHAAAGGVGLLLTQLAARAGARVLGLVSSEAKAAAARRAGAEQTILYSADWPAVVRAFADGRGADVIYDSVGTTLDQSLTATRTGGHVVFYGMAGGDPAPVDPRRLMDESKSLTGGDLWNVLTSAQERRRRSAELFGLLERGELSATIAKTFALSNGAEAHALLEGRGVIGKIVLLPRC